MSQCPRCGTEYGFARQFCGKCRSRMGTRCLFCGFINLQTDQYCGGCSADLREMSMPAGPAAEAEPDAAAREGDLPYDELLSEAHEDQKFTAQIAETLDQDEIRQLFHGDDEET